MNVESRLCRICTTSWVLIVCSDGIPRSVLNISNARSYNSTDPFLWFASECLLFFLFFTHLFIIIITNSDLFLFLDSFRKKKKKKYIFVLFLVLLLIKFEQFVTNCHSIRIVCRCWRPDSLSGIFYFEQNYRRWSGRNFKLPKCFSWRRKYYYVFSSSSSSSLKRCFSLVWVWDFDL